MLLIPMMLIRLLSYCSLDMLTYSTGELRLYLSSPVTSLYVAML